MCGIVGFSGTENALDILVNGLRKLEYRGYDSAGVVLQEKAGFTQVREVGKIANLEKEIQKHTLTGQCGIAHTRWATHGEPTVENAHPHLSADGKIAVVHNGIIENYAVLKASLEADGVKFNSDTDTEVLAHLISKNYNGDLLEAVRNSLKGVQGTFGVAVQCSQEPGVLVGARSGSPLILGITDAGIILASDVAAVVQYTQNVIYLDEHDLVKIADNQFRIETLERNDTVHRSVETVDISIEEISKQGFKHYMKKEIFEQPTSLLNTLRGRLLASEGTAKLAGLDLNIKELREIERIIMVGCGTSYYAGLVGEYLIEELAGIPVEVEYASEFRYRNPIVTARTIVICISQSGETADTLAALKEARRRGATVIGICNVVGSTLSRETAGGVYLHAGPEIGVASTKAFTSQVMVLSLIGLLLGRMRRVSNAEGSRFAESLNKIPGQVKEILDLDDHIKEVASNFLEAKSFLFLGRQINYPVALEGALKLKEISYIHSQGYPSAELKHGPLALIDDDMPVVVLAPKDELQDKLLSNVREVKARGGQIILIKSGDDPELESNADYVINIPETHPLLSPLLAAIPLQLFAYHLADQMGKDVDKPRNLAKSVTVE
jgi:glucosamine--fructose-6-phosphate aminotransferase (isomerizing)